MHETKTESVCPPRTLHWSLAQSGGISVSLYHHRTHWDCGKTLPGLTREKITIPARTHTRTQPEIRKTTTAPGRSVMHVVTSSHITSSHKQKCLHPFRRTIWKLSLWTNTSMLCTLLVASLSFRSWGQKKSVRCHPSKIPNTHWFVKYGYISTKILISEDISKPHVYIKK